MTLDRRRILTALGATAMTSIVPRAASAEGAFDQRLAELERSGRVFGLHALTVMRGGRMIFEHYGEGEDESWGGPLGHVTFDRTVMHDLRSVSKSVVSWLYGIALAQGKVPTPETRLSSLFPQYADLWQQPGRDQLTVEHVLTMTLGLEWDELTIPYGDPRNSEMAMEAAPDRYRYLLERPSAGPPGEKWVYNGGATTLLGRLIAEGTGEKLHAFARRVLFDPMEFGPSEWSISADGNERAASGLRLLPRDMSKIGQLVLTGGAWQGRQVVPADWVKTATTAKVRMPDGRGYGYHWYTGAFQDATHPPLPWIAGIGWGGQRLYVIPTGDLVIGINCGNYRRPGRDQHMVGVTIVTEVVLPAFG
jgi:CubicO group peptidase (beta-lactamase class C family)